MPQLLAVISESCDQMDALINDLLSFTEGREAAAGPWSPTAAVDAALRLLHPRLSGVRVHQGAGVPGFRPGQRRTRLNQVVLNLLDNALRAVTPRGQVWVQTEEQDGLLLMTVRDDGPGIAPAHLPVIFDPFFTTRTSNEGMGLGLHLCRAIVEAHGGDIAVSSTPGQGATFELRLPLRQRDARAA